MKLAIMQPYFLPYIGYWQLINAVDRFVIYDDVNYIKGGWINRNRILINSKPSYITIPLSQASPNKNIDEIEINQRTPWANKLLKTIENTYRKSENFSNTFPVAQSIIEYQTDSLSDYLFNSIITICNHLDIKTDIIKTSKEYNNSNLKSKSRVIDICHKENADNYINAIGGKDLYSKEKFEEKNIKLEFIEPELTDYTQKSSVFIPGLSIIDILMEAGSSRAKEMLNQYKLL